MLINGAGLQTITTTGGAPRESGQYRDPDTTGIELSTIGGRSKHTNCEEGHIVGLHRMDGGYMATLNQNVSDENPLWRTHGKRMFT